MSMSRWVPAIILAVMLAVAVPICADDSDAAVRPADLPTELAELQYQDAHGVKIVYVYPTKPIGSTSIPELPSGCTCWVREDTREVVTASTVFAQGSYLIIPYSWVPDPWDPEPTPEPTPEPEKDGKGTVEISTTAVCIGCGAVVIAVAVLGYFAVRRH